MRRPQGFGQVNLLDLFNIGGVDDLLRPMEVRIASRFLPDVTIRPGQGTGTVMRLLDPKIQILTTPGIAIEVSNSGVRQIDPKVFEQPTFLDRASPLTVLGILLLGAALVKRLL